MRDATLFAGASNELSWRHPATSDTQIITHLRCSAAASGTDLRSHPSDLGVYEITVEGGEVTDVDAPHWERIGQERGSIGFTIDYAGVAPTLSELAAEAVAVEAAGADVVELPTEPTDGRPTRLDIDWDEAATDDEACFIIGDYSVTDR